MRLGPPPCYCDIQLWLALLRARLEEVDDIVVQRESACTGWRGRVILARFSFFQHFDPFALLQESARFRRLALVLGHGVQHQMMASSVAQQRGRAPGAFLACHSQLPA